MTDKMELERREFEAELKCRWPNIALGRLQRSPEKYALDQLNLAWEMWQAARRAQADKTDGGTMSAVRFKEYSDAI